jgi:putative membrane protein
MLRATDVLANERTYLAYVRTALAFIAFGFVIARFSLFAREFAALVHSRDTSPGLSVAFGTAMAVCGIFIALFGAWRYAVVARGLESNRVVSLAKYAGYLISTVVAVVGAIVAIALLLYR